jgi:hypothetical protein
MGVARLRSPRWKWVAPGALLLALLLAPPATRAAAPGLLPDIMAAPPSEISLEVAEDGHRLLRFTQKFVNLGPGPLRVQAVPTAVENVLQGYQEILDVSGTVTRRRPVSSVIFHPHHNHWHADDFASYELRRGSPWGPLAASNGKISYCLVDEEQYPAYSGRYYPPTYLNCKNPNQGLNPGWADVYHADLHDQWVDVTGLADGVYYLVVTGDPHHLYEEADDGGWSNNTAWVKLDLTGGGTQVRVMAANEILVQVNGQRVDLPVPSRIRDDRALAHVRLAEHLGAAVAWDGAKVILTAESRRVEITPGQSTALVDGVPVSMGTEALMEANRVLVPVRFLCDQLGASVTYDGLAATVIIER